MNRRLPTNWILKNIVAWPMFWLCYWGGHLASMVCGCRWWPDDIKDGTWHQRLFTVFFNAYQGGMYHSTLWDEWGGLGQWRESDDVAPPASPSFSEFIRNATPEEKGAVYSDVMKRATERQNAAPQPVPCLNSDREAGSKTGGSQQAAAAAPKWKYECDADCRSPRCPAALERIAAGWRNGRDKE